MPNPTLSTAPFEHPALDYAFLRQEGIRHIERLAGHLWTDFNEHDPGITILEQVCYAITDLAYRAAYEVPDLLAAGDEDPYRSLYSPATILTCDPVTPADLRKLVLDVEGVANAWIETVDQPEPALYYHEGKRALSLQPEGQHAEPVYPKGLYRVLIEKSDLLDIDSATVQREAARRLHAHRPLCTDFEDIRVLGSQAIQVQAEIELAPVEDAERVLIEIYRTLSDYIAPPVPFATLQDMLAAGKRSDEIFEGPPLEHGFIDSQALADMERRTAIHTSDLIHAIMQVPGVRAVRDITVSAEGGERKPWTLALDASRAPRLDLHGSTITLARERLTVSLDVEAAIAAYVEQRRNAAISRKLPVEERDLVPPRGRDRNVSRYRSIQHQLPALYGIGELGLPASATPQRRAQARQLEAYLLFFDQLLANCFAQLARARDLFSFHGDGARTYFAQMLDDARLRLSSLRTRSAGEHRAYLDQITESTARSGDSATRKSRFLNHLMARFAEQLTDYSLVLFGATQGGATASRLVRDKLAFLQRYPRLSSARGTGIDYLRPRGEGQVSGLEERIRRKLGLVAEDGETFLLIEHLLLRPLPEDRRQLGDRPDRQVPLLAASVYKDPYSLQLSAVFPSWPVRFARSDFRRLVEQTVREETPAHLTTYIHWLDGEAWGVLEPAYRDWLDKHRRYWADKLGV